MKKFIYVTLFILSCVLLRQASQYADAFRGYNGLGGEVFLAIVPLMFAKKAIFE